MALFGKKNETKAAVSCCCSEVQKDKESTGACCEATGGDPGQSCCGENMNGVCCVKVLGAGCKSCHEQYENAKQAVENLGLNIEVEYITDMEKVMSYGVMSMPALLVNDKIVSVGKVLKPKEVEKLLK